MLSLFLAFHIWAYKYILFVYIHILLVESLFYRNLYLNSIGGGRGWENE